MTEIVKKIKKSLPPVPKFNEKLKKLSGNDFESEESRKKNIEALSKFLEEIRNQVNKIKQSSIQIKK